MATGTPPLTSAKSRTAFVTIICTICTAVIVLVGAEDKPGVPIADVQALSIADRSISATESSDFRSATEMPSVSPMLDRADAADLVIEYPDLLTAVVLKPKSRDGVYDIPEPPVGADVFRFLNDHLEEAAEKKVGVIRFPEGKTITLVPPREGAAHLKLEGFADAVINLNGCTLQCSAPTAAIVIENCQRMTLTNGTIRGKALLATVARIETDATEAGVRFEVLAEYRAALEASFGEKKPQLITVGDAELAPSGGWRIKVDGYSELFVNRGGKENHFAYRDGSFVGTSPRDTERPLVPGNHVWLLHYNNNGFGVIIDNEDGASDLTFSDLEFVSIPGMMIGGDIERGLHIDRVNCRLDSGDPLAFFAVSSDGIHINANGGDIVIENCDLGPNGDDKITNKGNYWAVTAIDRDSNKITVEPPVRKTSLNSWGKSGQTGVFIGGDFSVIGTAELEGDPFRDTSKRHMLTLTEIPNGVAVGTLVGNVDNAGARMVVRNNVLRETRAQGILVQTRHVVIEGNRFEGIASPAIKIALSLNDWYEGVATGNVLIRGNTFQRCSQSLRKSNELIHLDQRNDQGQAVEVIDRVQIEGNRIVDEGNP